MMPCEPTPQHAWLSRLIGEWTMEGVCEMGPGQPKAKSSGRETVRGLGGLWVVGESEMEMPGAGTGQARMTIGFDPAKGTFVGTWVGSMMANMWVYEGKLDAAQRVLTLSTTGPSCSGDGTTASYEDVIELVSETKRTLTSRMGMPDGSWMQFMQATYTRVK